MSDQDEINSDTFDGLTLPSQWQAAAVRDVLVQCGAYTGSPSDALTDATAITLAMRYAPEGDNHHNAAQCPYCNTDPPMTLERATARLFELGYYCIESEITPTWACFTVWVKFKRDERLSAGEPTIPEALARLVQMAEERARD